MKNIQLFFFGFLNVGSFSLSTAQVTDYIYGIDNPSSGVFYFSKAEITTGIITELTQVPVSFLSGSSSSCIDAGGLKYYYCSGDMMMTFDPVSGNLLSNQVLPLPVNSRLIQVQYNSCDSMIYGILNKSNPVSCEFARYNPAANTVTSLSSLPLMSFCMGCQAMLDPDSAIYSFFNGNMVGIDINTGAVKYNSVVQNYPGESFGHVALYCPTHQVFGTSANAAQSTKYMSMVNPYTGIVTHISESGWQAGFMKPATAGSCIDQSNHVFYYGATQLIVGADVLNGNMVYNQSTAPQTLHLIQHFTGCTCHVTGIEEDIPGNNFSVYPNPASTAFTIDANGTLLKAQVEIFNLFGERFFSDMISLPSIIQCDNFPSGIYFVQIQTNKGAFVQKLMKQ
jgi:hypothetical protein